MPADPVETAASLRRRYEAVPRGVIRLFEKLYALRVRVSQCGEASGDRRDRGTLERSTHLLSALVPAMLGIMIDSKPPFIG